MAVTSFISLPREIHDRIYDYYFDNLDKPMIASQLRETESECWVFPPEQCSLLDITASSSTIAAEARTSCFGSDHVMDHHIPSSIHFVYVASTGTRIDMRPYIRHVFLQIKLHPPIPEEALPYCLQLLNNYPSLERISFSLETYLRQKVPSQQGLHHDLTTLLDTVTVSVKERGIKSCHWKLDATCWNPKNSKRADHFKVDGPVSDLETLIETLREGKAPGHQVLGASDGKSSKADDEYVSRDRVCVDVYLKIDGTVLCNFGR
ncbi:uncharacterized protein KY384_001312 [Bacidia gigantensis]|uniref:uncharacterized protein n=1 Tax=Bacidia gigantensis TaxID=2732470 RepID=UPI001D040005|nr:uncharacterized protein KY384_001312 [Bacidia gigantensis]KAG8533572.1 hypothetical protein KY384_001312 [Bacidia gigantensis]